MSIASTPPPAFRRSAPLAHARVQSHLRPVPDAGSLVEVGPLPAVVSESLLVPTVDGAVDYANFDHAASTPALMSVKKAVDNALRTYSSVHRGNGWASRVTSAWYEQARAEVRSFVGAREGDEVVFTRNSTDSFNLLARCLPRDTQVFVFESEHHAALLPWPARRTHRLPVPGSVSDARTLLRTALRDHRGRHRLVVLAGASNVTGEIWPVRELAAIARQAGARVVLDGAQYAPHRRVDLDDLGVDYVVLSGHKLYAPFGTGVLAGRADWLDAATPYLAGGGATKAVTDRGVVWQEGAARHEGGSPNVIGAIALAAACHTLRAHEAAVEEHERTLGRRLLEGLAAIDGVQTYSLFGPEHERVAVATFTVDGVDSSLVSAALSAEHGIGVRDGKFCAHLCVDALLETDPYAEGPATAVRASVGLATTAAHVERLLAAVAELAAHGPAHDYQLTAEGWVVADDPRDVLPPRPW
ncbi:selenocysteine lyase/cysteine desulfurase [Phycicoccus badiiscoriae]|uniref:Selenocysteine lyase/cysteine desulfurase n=1 Tax=Pedococcus badiiscoriae TaxID=642776 RepID=A0A852WGW0_9MICO|nr:aminotransferase class V-fold PLP-dependent enzyme [Pedococcus badiiscoriae]NYG08070.1 selenocysteine lyase/cysteine desulfurase [Pedococcus badiiscoriae]